MYFLQVVFCCVFSAFFCVVCPLRWRETCECDFLLINEVLFGFNNFKKSKHTQKQMKSGMEETEKTNHNKKMKRSEMRGSDAV